MNRPFGIVWMLLFLGSAGATPGCDWLLPLSDLRPESLQADGIDATAEERGRSLLRRAASAHGGAAWAEHDTWEVVLEDRWSDVPWLRRRSPWPEGSTWLRLQFVPGSSDSRVVFLDGPLQDTAWGLVDGRTYAQAPGQSPVWGEAPAMASRLPTMQFLFEFPQRITEAPFVAHVGDREVGGRATEVVFAAWGSVEPHAHYDQFLVYIDAETDRILAMEYTVRKSGRTLLGHRFWRELTEVDGVLVPFFQTSLLDFDGEDPVHSFFVRDLRFDTVAATTIRHPSGE